MDENMEIVSRQNEFANLLEQLDDIDARLAAGLVDQNAYLELKARKLAYISALDTLAGGEPVDDDAFAALLADMREVAAQPTQEEVNAANIDYLMMIGGEL